MRRAVTVALVAALVGACSGDRRPAPLLTTGTSGPGPAVITSGRLRIVPGAPAIGPAIRDGRLVLPGGRTVVPPGRWQIASLAPDSPTAAISRDGKAIVYTAIIPGVDNYSGTPPAPAATAVRIVDVASGRDRILARSGFGAVFRGDGALAYVQGDRLSVAVSSGPTGYVVVRSSVTGVARRLLRHAGSYSVIGWAGRSLLVLHRSGGTGDLSAVDEHGHARRLGRDVFPVAVSPDGSLALLASNDVPQVVRLVSVVTGAILRTTTIPLLARLAGLPSADAVGANGSWVGNRILASTTTGAILLRASATELAAVAVLGAPPGTSGGVEEPSFGPDGRTVVGWLSVDVPRLAVCDLVTLACRVDRTGTPDGGSLMIATASPAP